MDEYISREAAIKFAADGEYCAQAYHDRRSEYYYTNLKKAFLKIPVADVRLVVHGEWQPAQDGFYYHVMCSACHKIESHKTNFCPSCGATMDGGVNNATIYSFGEE